MAIEWEETVETKRRVRMLVGRRGSPSAPAAAVWAPGFRDATVDDLRRACEAVGLVVETRERAAADLAGRTNLREAYQRLADEQDACLDALSEHVSPDGTVTTPRMVRPSSLLAGIRSLQGRLRDARSDLREHDAELEAANARAEKAEADRDDLRAKLEQALSILNAMPGDDIVSAASHMMDVRRRQSEDREAMRYDLSTIINESFGPQPVMTHEELLSFLEDKIKQRGRDLASARARIAELEAPMPEATVEELFREFCDARAGLAVASRTAIRAVAERVRRERCLIARAVAGGVDVTLTEDMDSDGEWCLKVAGRDEAEYDEIPAAEVPAVLARMLTEVGA